MKPVAAEGRTSLPWPVAAVLICWIGQKVTLYRKDKLTLRPLEERRAHQELAAPDRSSSSSRDVDES